MNEQQGLDPMFQENGSQWMEGGLASEPLNVYTAKTFGWMFLGLLVTFGTAIAFSAGGGLYYLLTMGMPAVFALAIAEIVVVMVLSARLHKLSIGAARGLFFAYAVLNGITFSAVFFAYDVQILLTVFALTSLYFGVLAAYGWFTKRDLSGLRPILTAGLIFLLVFWLISMFLPLSGFDRIICFVGLAVFMGLTAYDTQKIKQLHAAFEGDYGAFPNATRPPPRFPFTKTHGQRRVAQALGQSVAACVQQARHLGNMPKVAVQLEDAGHRHRQVARKGCACRTQQHNAQRAGHGAHQCRHRGLDAFHNGHHGHAPG